MIKFRPLTIGSCYRPLEKMNPNSKRFSPVEPTVPVDPFEFKEVDPVIAVLSNPPKSLQHGGKRFPKFPNDNGYTSTSEYYVG